MKREAEMIRRAAIEEACAVLCEDCRDRKPVKRVKPKQFVHEYEKSSLWCFASEIREMLEE